MICRNKVRTTQGQDNFRRVIISQEFKCKNLSFDKGQSLSILRNDELTTWLTLLQLIILQLDSLSPHPMPRYFWETLHAHFWASLNILIVVGVWELCPKAETTIQKALLCVTLGQLFANRRVTCAAPAEAPHRRLHARAPTMGHCDRSPRGHVQTENGKSGGPAAVAVTFKSRTRESAQEYCGSQVLTEPVQVTLAALITKHAITEVRFQVQ